MILATHGIVQSSGAFEPEYLAILNYATTQGYALPSVSVQNKQNKLLRDLKEAGIWSKLDTFAVFAGGSGAGNSNFSLIDWVRLSQMTNVNGCTFSGNGFTGDGIDSYINTNFDLLNDSVNYTQNSASKFGWINGTPIDNKAFDGCISAINVFSLYNSSNIRNIASNQWRINTSTNGTGGTSSAVTSGTNYLLHFYRDSATSSGFYKNTTLTGSGNTISSTILINNFQTIMAGQSTWNFSTLTISAYGMGDDLSSENTDLYNALNTYIASL
jgi:hypothetical protein